MHPYKSIITLHESGIPIENIAFQLDLDIKEIIDAIEKMQVIDKEKEDLVLQASKLPKLGMLLIDPVFNINSAIKDAQKRMWYQLKVKSDFNVSQENTQRLLEKFIGTTVPLVVLHVDLVGSTDLSMNLSLKRLVPIIQAFTQEMSLIIEAYGGYVFKYVGDAILSFFFTEKDDLYVPCANAVGCAYSMVTIIQQGMNTILELNGYPELGIRIGIDVGENAIVQYGLRPETTTSSEKVVAYNVVIKSNDDDSKSPIKGENVVPILRKPHLDILGYTINIATKMTNYAKPNQIIIGEAVYKNLDTQIRKKFRNMDIENIEWNYINNSTGNTYELYINNYLENHYFGHLN
jgi:adenylate cyclase